MSTISSGSSGLTWTSDNSSNLAITLTSIVDNTGNTVSGSTVVKGAVKAWVNFNGSTGTIRSSYNVGSITKNTTGDYTINFTTAMTNTNYAQGTGTSYDLTSGNGTVWQKIISQTTSNTRIYSINGSGGILDATYLSVMICSN
jgi:hypothetical protein